MRRIIAVAVVSLVVLAGVVGGLASLYTGLAFLHPGPASLHPGLAPPNNRPPAAPDLTRTPAPIATGTAPRAGGAVPAPSTGVLLGAWVRPAQLTQPARVAAVATFERFLGRPLAIVNTYRRWTEPFLTESDQWFLRQSRLMVSWAGPDSREITSGRADDLIQVRARQLAADGRPVLLRYRWEMDRPNLRATMGSGPEFIAAWRHLHDLFRRAGASNVAWVWCPTAEGFDRGEAAAFYPGDDVVDWICVDVYAATRLVPLGDLLVPFLHWAAARPKPIMLGEFGVARAYPAAQRAQWLRNAAATVTANPQIKAACYFESNPDGNPARQQFRLSDDATALAAFVAIARDPYFSP